MFRVAMKRKLFCILLIFIDRVQPSGYHNIVIAIPKSSFAKAQYLVVSSIQ